MNLGSFSKTTILFLTFILLFSAAINAQNVPIDEITKITVEGNDYVSNFEILSKVSTEVGEQTDQEALRQDLQAVYDMGYFSDVNIVFENYEQGLNVIFQVVENPVLKGISIEGNQGIYSKEKIKEILDLKLEYVLNAKKMNENLKKLQERMQDDGYILARYRQVNVSDEGILNIEIVPGTLDSIEIVGNDKTEDDVILREMPIKAGDLVNIKKIQQGYRNLFRLEYFNNINPELERVNAEENTAKLIINLEEGKTGRLNFGGGYSSTDGLLGFIDVSEKNLFGNGQNIQAKWQFGDTTTYSLNFYEPYLWDSNYSFGFSVYDSTTEEENSVGQVYEESKRGGSITLGHPLPKDWRTSLKYRLEDAETDWEDPNITDDSTELRSLTLGFSRDSTDNRFHPRSGSINNFSTEHAGDFLGGTADFTKFNIDSRRYFPAFKDHALAFRVKAGISYPRTELPSTEEYNLGGSNSLRGYERSDFDFTDRQNNNLLLFNLEYRIPFNDSFTGVLFTDAGNVWEDRDKIALNDLYYGYGLGLRMNTPVGQLRLDYGWDEDQDGQFHFSIGNAF
jgi:outer membrane protein insertion porin family